MTQETNDKICPGCDKVLNSGKRIWTRGHWWCSRRCINMTDFIYFPKLMVLADTDPEKEPDEL